MVLRQRYSDWVLSGATQMILLERNLIDCKVRQTMKWLNSSQYGRSTPNKMTRKNGNIKLRDSSPVPDKNTR